MSDENRYGQQQPPYPPYGYPPYYHHPHMGYPHPGYPPYPPYGYQPYGMPNQGMGPMGSAEQAPDPMMQQAKQMVDGMMGEQAGLFHSIVGKLGVDDKEFWKGAMIGAAAAMLMTNPNVKKMLMEMLGGVGEMFKPEMQTEQMSQEEAPASTSEGEEND